MLQLMIGQRVSVTVIISNYQTKTSTHHLYEIRRRPKTLDILDYLISLAATFELFMFDIECFLILLFIIISVFIIS